MIPFDAATPVSVFTQAFAEMRPWLQSIMVLGVGIGAVLLAVKVGWRFIRHAVGDGVGSDDWSEYDQSGEYWLDRDVWD